MASSHIDFSKMSLLSAPTKAPVALFQHQNSDVVTALGPALQFALQCQRALSNLSLFLFLRSWFIAAQLLVVGRFAARFAMAIADWSGKGIYQAWNSKPACRLRKKFEFEFYTFVLGAGGNNLLVVVFWPGWWILTLFALGIWAVVG